MGRTDRRPNVIVFFTDQQRHDVTGVHGCPLGLTPNLDLMAAEGTHFYHSYTCQPVCGPARSALQSGRYPTRTGCYRNAVPMPTDVPTLGKVFAGGGYATGYIGKWHLGPGDVAGAVAKEYRGGYEDWLAANALEMTSDAYDTRLYDGDGKEVRLPGYRVDAMTDAMVRWIDAKTKQDRPFMLFTSFLEPHHQNHRDDYPGPRGWEERYMGNGWVPPDLRALPSRDGSAMRHWPGYCAMVKKLDDALGRVRDAVESLGIAAETVILFTSDHACHFKTRNSEYKRSCHDSSIRVPTVAWGGPFMQGGRVMNPVSLIDLPATLVDVAGLEVPGTFDGKSLMPLVRKEREHGVPGEVFVQISESQVGRAIRTPRWTYAVVAKDKDGWRDAGSDRYEEAELYDNQADPWQLMNLIGVKSHAALSAHLRERLLRRMEQAGEARPEITPAPERPGGQRRVEEREWV